MGLLYPEELVHAPGPVSVDPAPERRELGRIDRVRISVEIIEEIDSLAVRVTTDHDVLDIVEDAGQLKHRGFRGDALVRHEGAGGEIFQFISRPRTKYLVKFAVV